jgi:hypothetical protein
MVAVVSPMQYRHAQTRVAAHLPEVGRWVLASTPTQTARDTAAARAHVYGLFQDGMVWAASDVVRWLLGVLDRPPSPDRLRDDDDGMEASEDSEDDEDDDADADDGVELVYRGPDGRPVPQS